MGRQVVLSGDRDVRATHERADAGPAAVACPPHPHMGGNRSDPRLRAICDALGSEVACLRIDYGPWNGGHGECRDVITAVKWTRERHEPVALFGYSFGGSVALLAATTVAPAAVSALSPVDSHAGQLDVVAAVEGIESPIQVIYGDRDTTAYSDPVADRARSLGHAVTPLPTDHFYGGQTNRAADVVAEFLREHL